jgi:hypothetical protein
VTTHTSPSPDQPQDRTLMGTLGGAIKDGERISERMKAARRCAARRTGLVSERWHVRPYPVYAVLLTDDNMEEIAARVRGTGTEVPWMGTDTLGRRAFSIATDHGDGERHAATGMYLVRTPEPAWRTYERDAFETMHARDAGTTTLEDQLATLVNEVRAEGDNEDADLLIKMTACLSKTWRDSDREHLAADLADMRDCIDRMLAILGKHAEP